MSEPEYPKRDQFFAHKFVRMLTKDAVANELGSDACWLLTVIALQEDAKRYRAPVTFYTHQLAVLCGCENDKKLARIRDRIVKAGWLMYLPGGKGVPGRYWCIVPDRASDITDGPCDEGGREPGENRETNGNEAGDKREESGKKASSIRELTNLSPNPTPDPNPAEGEAVEESLTAHQVVVTEWNVAGPKRCMRLTSARRKVLSARLKEAWWREHWREGLARLPTARFLWGENDSGWKADFDWFIKPDSLTKILEGKYDSGAKSNRQLPLVGLNRFGGKEAAGDERPGKLIGGEAKEFPFTEGDGVGPR